MSTSDQSSQSSGSGPDDSAGEQPQRSVQKPGCFSVLLVLGIAALAVGIYLINRWDALGGGGKTGSIILIVVGTLLVIPYLVLTAFQLFLRIALRKMTREFAQVGQGIIDNNAAMYGQIHEFRDASEQELAEVDASPAYQSATAELEALGFRVLGNLVDETIEQLQGVKPVIRVMVSADGGIIAGIYEFPQSFPGAERVTIPIIYDLATEFSNGTWVISSNTQGLDMMTPPPQIYRRQFEPGIPLVDGFRQHDLERQRIFAEKPPGTTTTIINTLQEAIEAERRQQAIKNAFRQGIGFADPEEIRRIAANSDLEDDSIGDSLADAVDRARKNQPDQ